MLIPHSEEVAWVALKAPETEVEPRLANPPPVEVPEVKVKVFPMVVEPKMAFDAV